MNDSKRLLSLSDSVTELHGVGSKRAETLKKLEIITLEDLLRYYPKRYEDRRRIKPVRTLIDGEAAIIRVFVKRVDQAPVYTRGRTSRAPMKVHCYDESGELTLLFWNTRWMAGAFKVGEEYWVYGTAKRDLVSLSMAHPEFDSVTDDSYNSEQNIGIVPVYPLTAGLSQKYLRSLIHSALPTAQEALETLPEYLLLERKLAPLPYALKNIHFPEDEHALNAARYRLIYEELYLLQYRLLEARSRRGEDRPEIGEITCDPDIKAKDVCSVFPFEPTNAQQRVVEEIRSDMSKAIPMRRLLQGDVGSGKTAVAAAGALFAARSGFQSAIMAPTEILAIQHYKDFEGFLADTGIKVGLLTSGLSQSQKRDVKEGIKTGDIKIAIGTHALIEPDIVFSRLGLVVTDEQHRFGVKQRLALNEKANAPDTLVMTATPIPRTLAMMLYADLDVSILDEMPPGRQKVATRFVNSSKRIATYAFAEKEMSAGRQVYVVAPMIEEGEESDSDDADTAGLYNGGLSLASTEGLEDELRALFPKRRVASLHGKMKGEQKEKIMQAFVEGEIDLLVSTVVIEVGVNVPNASMMIIENAERFGLAQLHQLRGRVGRGEAKSYCVLISDSTSEIAVKRLETLAKEHDGFHIAELDLELRGPGDLFGVRQHGLPELKIADPAKHMSIMQLANSDVKRELNICG